MSLLLAQAVRQVGGRLEGADTGLEARAATPVRIGAAVDREEATAGEVAAETTAKQAGKQEEENLRKKRWSFPLCFKQSSKNMKIRPKGGITNPNIKGAMLPTTDRVTIQLAYYSSIG